MHGWGIGNVKEEIAMLKAVGERVGGKMKIMYDAGCNLSTLADALEVGRVCDDYDFYWYEDPYKDGGVSINGNQILSQNLSTPLLVGEHMRNLETSVDMLVNGSSFFPFPAAIIFPFLGFSFAVSGIIIPPAVVSSAAAGSTITRSARGFTFNDICLFFSFT